MDTYDFDSQETKNLSKDLGLLTEERLAEPDNLYPFETPEMIEKNPCVSEPKTNCCGHCCCHESDLLKSADLSISEYMKADSLVDSDSEKSFELLYSALLKSVTCMQFDELIAALSKFKDSIIQVDIESEKIANKLFVNSSIASSFPFSPAIAAKGIKLMCLREVYALKADLVQMAARDLFHKMPKEKIRDIDNVMALLECDVSESILDSDDSEDFEDESLVSFAQNKYALTELEPSFTLYLKNLLKETNDPFELLSAVESIQEVINEITSRNEWVKEHYETEIKAAILKREMVLDRLKDVLNKAHNKM